MLLSKNIKIVYFIYLNPGSNWQAIVSGQLKQLKSYGILDKADLYIHITDCFNLANEATNLVTAITPLAIISINNENQFEYPGLKLIYDLSNQFPTNNFIYFHAKGMSHNLKDRVATEVILFTQTFEHWEKNIKKLGKNGIRKIGLFPAVWLEKPAKIGEIGGWIWYNYWYATGEYLSNCEEPKPQQNRYYYEGWLARYKSNDCYITNDCKSLYKIPFVNKNYFTPAEADYYLGLPLKPKSTLQKIFGFLQGRFIAYCYLKIKKYKSKA